MNEITCVPKLLDKLALERAVVTMDAMGTQVEIAEADHQEEGGFYPCTQG